MTTAVLLVGDREVDVDAAVDGARLLVGAADFASATGWLLKPEGFCRGEVCVPVRDRDAVVADGMLDVAGVAAALRLPCALDAGEHVAAIAERSPAAPRPSVLQAPDFTLPTIDGGSFTFSSVGRKKKVLAAWASW
jgi:hypothetical protein